MCNRYYAPGEREIEEFWAVGRQNPQRWWDDALREIFPRAQGPFIRRNPHDAGYSREAVVGQWGLIPWFAKEARLKYPTNNARAEELAHKASFKQPWARGQRCVIPATSFDEPNWESGKNVWWRFERADGQPWSLAGLWNAWTDPATGEVRESYTMLTLNADAHPLMRRMHKPDPALPAERQDKRSVIPIAAGDVDAWLSGTVQQAQDLLRLPAADHFIAGPVPSHGASRASA